jgi:hypothetical protein
MSWEEKEKDRSYHELARVTENFNEDSVLGSGSFTSGTVVAIKVLDMQLEAPGEVLTPSVCFTWHDAAI